MRAVVGDDRQQSAIGVIGHEGLRLDGDVFVSFDRQAEALLKGQWNGIELLHCPPHAAHTSRGNCCRTPSSSPVNTRFNRGQPPPSRRGVVGRPITEEGTIVVLAVVLAVLQTSRLPKLWQKHCGNGITGEEQAPVAVGTA